MSQVAEHDVHFDDEDDNFTENDVSMGFNEVFKDSKTIKKQHRAQSRKNARRRVEDYMERKAFKEKMNEWDNGFDY